MKTSARIGVAGGAAAVLLLATPLIAAWEGTIFRGYRDPIGVVTSCTGHTKTAVFGKVYTPAECKALLQQDLADHAQPVLQCLPGDAPVEVKAAFVSFAFNVGVHAACSSTASKKARAGDYWGACNGLMAWTYAKGKKLPGLVNRRKAERDLCLKGLP